MSAASQLAVVGAVGLVINERPIVTAAILSSEYTLLAAPFVFKTLKPVAHIFFANTDFFVLVSSGGQLVELVEFVEY